MLTRTRRLLPALFVALLAAQLAYGHRYRQPRPPPDPVAGQLPPPAQVELLGDGRGQLLSRVIAGKGSCSLVVVCSTACGICQGMRTTWPAELPTWTDSLAAPIRAVWLFSEPEEAVAGFFQGYDFDGIGLARLERGGGHLLWRLGFIGTPTTYVFDREGRYRLKVLGNRLPAADSVRAICR